MNKSILKMSTLRGIFLIRFFFFFGKGKGFYAPYICCINKELSVICYPSAASGFCAVVQIS